MTARRDKRNARGRRGVMVAFVIVAGIGASATAARAQGTPDARVALDLTGGLQATTSTFSQTVTFEVYSESGSLTTAYATTRRPVVDGGVVVRLWRNVGIGIAGSPLHDSGTAQVSAQVPNPLVFGQPRQVSGPASVAHNETALHVQAVYWARLTPRLDLTVTGGPSIFKVDQDFVSDVTYTQTYPYTTATYTGATTVRESETVKGGNIGVEADWRLFGPLSLAAAVRYSHASASFAGTSAQAVPVGGVQVGGGIRIRF